MKVHKVPAISFKEYGVLFISKVIGIYQELLPAHYRLTDKELEFYSNLIYLYNTGYDIASKEFNQKMYKLISGITKKNRGIYGYKRTLKNKKWLIQTTSGYTIPDIFKIKESIQFEIKITYGN